MNSYLDTEILLMLKTLFILLLLFPLSTIAQQTLPSYPEVLKEFFSRYVYEPSEAQATLSFASGT